MTREASDPDLDPLLRAAFADTPDEMLPAPGAVRAETLDELGNYRILREIGRGGMGVVYEAEQKNPKRTVALKVIAPHTASSAMLRRFEHEAQILGRLDHPGIAKIYEAGTFERDTGTQPYFAMELVLGQTLSDHVAAHGPNTRERVELLIQICDAVHHAHQKGVIHRDLKPGNVLVTEDERIKVLDFGVARLSDRDVKTTTLETLVGQVLGTLPYMSPEQASGDPEALDTRSDVYALGVVAYELLCGRLPLTVSGRSIPEALRVIQEDKPDRLSTTHRHLRGDLDTIVQTALEKDKERRYDSAAAMAQDLRRFLEERPIAARPASAWYQLRKFARRNRLAVGLTAAVFVSLVAGIVVSTDQYVQAQEALDEANLENRRASELNRFLLEDLLEASHPDQGSMEKRTVEDLLENAYAKIDGAFPEFPEVEATVLFVLGKLYRDAGNPKRELELLRKSSLLCDELFGAEDRESLRAREGLARALMHNAEYEESLEVLDGLEQSFKRIASVEGVISVDETRGEIIYRKGNWAESEAVQRRVLEAMKAHGTYSPRDLNRIRDRLATAAYNLKRYPEAAEAYEEIVAFHESEGRGDSLVVAGLLHNQATVLAKMREYERSEDLYVRALEILEERLGTENQRYANSLMRLGRLYYYQGRNEDSEAMLREALDIQERVLDSLDPDVIQTLGYLDQHLFNRNANEEAIPYRRRIAAGYRQNRGTGSRAYQIASRRLGEALVATGQYEEAFEVLREIEALGLEASDEEKNLVGTRWALAKALTYTEEYAEAEELLLWLDERCADGTYGTTLAKSIRQALEHVYTKTDRPDEAAAWR